MMPVDSVVTEWEPFGFDSAAASCPPAYRRKTREELECEARRKALTLPSLSGLAGVRVLQAAFHRLLMHWETVALASVIGWIISSLSTVLWPMPTAEFALRSFPIIVNANEVNPSGTQLEAGLSEALLESETLQASSFKSLNTTQRETAGKLGSHVGRVHWHHTPKKTKHPPIQNLNTATLAKLQLLPGIGPKMAERIIAYRKLHGPFTNIAQVMEVKGIGEKKFEKMKPFLKL